MQHVKIHQENRCELLLDFAQLRAHFSFLQLEEANRTLTSDVANLANEKEELNNKLTEAVEGS